MTNVRKTLQMSSLLFGMIVLFCFIAWHLGYDGFILVGDIYMPMWLNKAICTVLFSINYMFMLSFNLNEYSKKSLKLALPFLVFYAFSMYLFPSTIVSGPVSTLYIIFLGFIRKDFKRTTLRVLISMTLTIVYQMLAILMKTGTLYLDYDISLYTTLMMNIDMILFSALLWAIGGVKNERRWTSELVVFPGRVRDDQRGDESRQIDPQSAESLPVGRFETWVMRFVIITVQVLQWIFILWVCNLDNLFLDALVMTTSFICHGMIISKRKHFKPILLCTLVATVMFYIAAKITISIRYSHFFPIVIGLLLVYAIYRISYEIEKSNEEKLMSELVRTEQLKTQIDKAWDHIDKLS